MFGFERWWVILLILAIVLIVYGPGKLPEVGGAIGKAFREFRRASSDLQDEIKRGTSPTNDPSDGSTESRPSPPATDVKPTDTKA
ncbi:MAG: twin-arginine translocase TatA/TatE family subunit [Chloroflexi bacterium]|nr:MAG: twin-arginine translocase TatA/TatE family subunit [Chloroflexota bacterium]